MTKANIYLTYNGNCEEAFNFYKSVLGGEFLSVSRFKEMPPMENGTSFPADQGERLMHITLPVGGDTIFMRSDTGGDWASDFKQGNNFSISLTTDTKEEADRLFNELSAG